MSEPMPKEQLTTASSAGQPAEGTGQLPAGGQFELAATHQENSGLSSSLGPRPSALDTEPRDMTPGDVKEMFGPSQSPLERLTAQGASYDSSLIEIGGGGDGELSIKRQLRVNWEKALADPAFSTDRLILARNDIARARQEKDKTKWPAWIRGNDEKGLTVDWLVVGLDKEIFRRIKDDLRKKQRQEGSAIPLPAYAQHRWDQLVLDRLQRPEDQREFKQLDLFIQLSNESPESKEWELNLRETVDELSKQNPEVADRWLKALVEQFRRADILAQLPVSAQGRSLLSPEVDFRSALNSLQAIIQERKINVAGIAIATDADLVGATDKLLPGAEIAKTRAELYLNEAAAQMAGAEPDVLRGGGISQNLAGYMFEPEVDKVMRLAQSLTQEERNQWVARLTGTALRAGRSAGRAGIYLAALGGDEEASSIESAIAKGQDLVNKMLQLGAYLKPDQLQQATGFFKPEELAALTEAEIEVGVWIRESGRSELIQRTVRISPKDILATFYRTDVMRELLANQASGDLGYWEARGKWFKYTFWRRAGYTAQQANRFVTNREESPEVVMTNQLTMTTRRNVNSLERWLGENWWMIMEAEAALMMSRSDYSMMPIDEFARRLFLGLRNIEQADYTRLYDLGHPFMQEMGGITYLPEYFSIIAPETIVAPLMADVRRNAGETMLNPERAEDGRIYDLRRRALERLVMIEQPSPSQAKELAKMALGLEGYEPVGASREEKIADWQRKVNRGIMLIDKTGIPRLRLPELWGDVTPEHLGMTQSEMENAWENFDFEAWLRQEGLHDDEISAGPTRGIAGWERFKRNASLRLMRMTDAQFRDYDKSFRYLIKVSSSLDAVEQLFKIDLAGPGIGGPEIGEARPLNETQARALVVGAYQRFTEALTDQGQKLVLGDFVPRDVAQRMYRTVIQGYRDSNCGWNMDKTYTEDIELKKVGPGTTFSVRRIHLNDLVDRWREILGPTGVSPEPFIRNQILPHLRGHQMYFVQSMEMERKGDSPVLIGPHSAFVPSVKIGRRLYQDLMQITQKYMDERLIEIGREHIDQDTEYDRLARFRELLTLDNEVGYHCWSRIRDGAWIAPPQAIAVLVEAIDTTANLAGSFTEQMIQETDILRRNGVISDVGIADDGWRFWFTNPSLLDHVYYFGHELTKPTKKFEIRRDKRGRRRRRK